MERKQQRHGEGFNAKKLWRAALFASTGLSAVLSLPAIVRAQTAIAGDTTPQGGVVVGGSASIAQAPASTTINQSSERAAINWQSFDVGSGAKVQFNQPDQNAIALNRVVGGNLSQINGQINANGQIVLINQSGVIFGKGSQINAENIVVSTSDISNKDFMAGNMAFTGAPNPGAKILNEGNITVKDTGLVGLIAPQVENDGVITARLGQVILAGASAFTLDMYGDRLISLDVTKAVQAVDVGGKLVPALVTNRGVILADGGKVLLTAQDADALVTQLIDAGGTIRANSVGGQAGTISLQGVGGNINIAGNLLAKGTTGSAGGAIEALTTGTVAVASTADIDASGDAGGGVIAIGTDLVRAEKGKSDITAPKAAAVFIAAGATLAADAAGTGNGGAVALLSARNTEFDGLISVRGGPNGGNGGSAEISSDGVISLSGTVLATAIDGKPGEILLDPATLIVSSSLTANDPGSFSTTFGGFDQGATGSTVSPTALDGLSGNVTLEAGSFITVASAISMASANALSLISEGSIVVSASIQVAGSLEIDATTSLSIGAGLTASNILLTSGTAGTDINGGVTATAIGGTVALGSGGTVFEGSAGSIISSVLLSHGSIGGDASLAGGNTITTLDGFTLGGTLDLADAGALTVGGSVSAANISLSGASLTFESGVKSTGVLALSSNGTIFQGAGTVAAGTLTGNGGGLVSFTKANAIGTLGAFSMTSGSLDLNDATTLDIGGSVSAANISLSAADIAFNANANATGLFVLDSAGNITEPAGTIGAATLTGSIGGNADLSGDNLIGTLGNFSVSSSNLQLGDNESLVIAGKVSVTAAGDYFDYYGDGVTEISTGSIDANGFSSGGTTIAGDILLTGSNTIANIQNVVATGTFALNDTASLTTGGSVTAPDITLFADGINFGSLVSASGTLAIGGNGAISQSGGSFSVGTLVSVGTVGGDVSFGRATNSIGSVGNFTLAGNLDLNDTGLLNIAGTMATPRSITLSGASSVNEPGGIDAGTLTTGGGSIGGSALLDGANLVGTLGNFTVASQLDLNDGHSLAIAGTVDVPGSFVYYGKGVTETGAGAIDAGAFTTNSNTVAGDILLTGSNAISRISNPLYATGTFALNDTQSLDVVENVAAADVIIAAPTLALDSGITIAATAVTAPQLALAADEIDLGGGNTFLAGNGTISIAPFSGGTTIDIGGASSAGTLGLPGSLIAALDSSASTYLIGSGPAGTRAVGIDIDGSASFANTATLDLSTSGTIFDNSGNLTTGTLDFFAAGITQASGAAILANLVAGTASSSDVLLGSGLNNIVSLGSVSVGAGRTLALVDGGTLTIAGAIDPAVVTLYGSMGLVIDNDVSASSQVSLGSGGDVVQTAGSITTPTLASFGSIGGDATLTSATNSISTISGFTLGGTLDLANAGSLTVGTVDAGNITLSAGGIGFTGAVTSSNVLALASSGDITQSGGSITATTLSSIGTIGGDALFTGTTNSIGTLGGFLAANTLSVFDSIALATEGTVAAPTVSLDAAGITLTGTVAAPTELALGGMGNIDETNAGAISAGSLVSIGTIAGFVQLGFGATDATVRSIGNFSLTGDFRLDNQTSADITGLISTPDRIVEFVNGGVTETGAGAIDASQFDTNSVRINGDVLLTGSNTIGAIDSFGASATGTFALNDTVPLTVHAGVTGADVTIAAPTLSLDGNFSNLVEAATGGTLAVAANAITLIGNPQLQTTDGTIAIAPYSASTVIDFGSLSSPGTLGLPGSIVSAFDPAAAEIIIGKGPVGTQASAIDIDNSVSFGGTSIVDLSTSGLILQNGGTFSAATLEFDSTGFTQAAGAAIDAGTLQGDGTPITGSVLLLGAANSISTLNGFSLSSGTFALLDTGSLDAAGLITAPIVTLASDTIGLNGSVSATSLLALGGTLITGAGSISTASLVSLGTVGSATLTGANSIAALGGFTLTGDLALNDAIALDIAGAVTTAGNISLTGTGLTESTGSLAADTLTTGAGSFSGNVSLGGANSLAALGDFTLGGSLALNDAIGLDIAGLVTTPHGVILSGTSLTESAGTIAAATLTTGGSGFSGSAVLDNVNYIGTLGNFGALGGFTLADSAPTLHIAGLIQTSNVFLSAGDITETGAGVIDAGNLAGGSSGFALFGDANTLASLGTFNAGGDFLLADTVSLDITGSVTAADIALTAPAVSLDANLDSTLAGGSIALAANAITLGSGQFLTNNGTIALAPQTPNYGVDIGGSAANDLDITGSLASAFPAGTAEIIIGRALGSLASNIVIDAPVTFASTVLQLSASGTIADNSTLSANTLAFDSGGFFQIVGGAVDATLLRGDGFAITGPVVLNGGANSIATLGSITTPSDIRIRDTAALDVTGPVTGADIYLTDSNAGGINVAGSLVAGSGGQIGLVSGVLTETGGTISAPNGLVYLSPYTLGNSIDLGGTGGDLNLASGFINLISSKVLQIGTAAGGAITQDSVVSVASPTLVLAGSSIDFAGTLSVPALLSFASAGDVSEGASATISVPALTGMAGGTIGLVGGNAIGTLDSLSAGGNITVNNVPSLLIAGLVSTGTGNSITLDDGSNVIEIAGGGLSAGTLGGSIGGNAFLTTGNTIGELNDLTVDGLLLFTNAGGGPLDLGSITTGNASFSAAGITITGLMDIGGGAGTLGLFSTGGITEASAAGIIDAGELYGTDSGGQVSLGSANTIASLGSFAAGSNNFSLNNAIGLDIASLFSVSSGNYIALTGTSLTESTGIIDAGTLAGSFSAGVSLAAANSIGTLGAFTLSAGTLTLDDTGLLNIAGPVNAPSTTLVAQTMAIAGTITAADALALESAGNVYETTGLISTPSLTTGGGTIGGFASFGNSNSVASLGGFTADGDLTLVDGGLLTVNGPVSAANAYLSAAGIAIDGAIGAGIADLASSLGITESGSGIIGANTLTGTSAESVSLLDANTIATLGGFSVTSGNFGISNTSVLDIAGLVTATGTITLEGAGATEVPGGTLAAAVLDSGGTALAGNVDLGNTNGIGTLGGFTLAAGTLVLADAGSLDLGGIVAAPFTTLTANTIGGTGTLSGTEATLSASSIDIGGLLSLTTDLALESSGEVSESTGAIVTPTLTSGGTSITGDATLARAANSIGTLGGFTLGGTLDLADAGTLTITGPAVLPAATITASSITVAGAITGGTDTLSAGGIAVAGSISLSNLLALVSTGSITEPGGFITVPTLTSGGTTIGGNVTLADQNSIGTVAGFTVGSGGTLDLTDSGLLTIAGPVVTPFATLTASTLSVTGGFSGTSATFAAGGGGIGVTGSISLATLLALASGGAVTESGAGVITAGTLVSAGPSINGNVLLANTLNNISTLGGFTIGSGDTLVLDDGGLLTVVGPVVATYSTIYAGTLAIAGSLSGASETLSGGNIDIEAAISVANDLALETPGSVTESTGGTITAGTLTTGGTTIGGNAVLASINSIGTIAGFTLGGTLDLADLGSPTLAIAGQVVAPASTLTANTIVSLLGSSFSGTSATFSAGSIDIGGLVSLTSDLALASTGDITESTGTVDVPLLTSGGTTIGGDVALTNNTNNIGTLGGFTLAPGGSLSLALDDNVLLTVAGPVSAPDAVLSAGSISITGAISIAQTLALEADAGGIVESTGSIVAGTLTSGSTTIQGDVALGNANDIATLSSFAATGFILLDNSPSLTIDGFVTTPGALTLAQTGPVTEIAGGTLAVGTLSSGGVATGDVALGNANSITTLGGFTVSSGDTLALNDTGLLTIAGPVAAPFATLASGTIAVTGSFSGTSATFAAGGGGIGITGSISLATLLAFASGGAVTESGAGVITAGTLVSAGPSINGNVLLANTLNNISTLGGFTIGSGDTLVLDDAGLLTVVGPVIATYSTLYAGTLDIAGPISGASETLSGGNIDINAAVSITNDLALETPGSVTETSGGTITAGTLTTGGTTIGGNAVLASLNSIGTLGGVTGLTIGGTLDLADTGTPTLAIAGNVVAATSTLTANTIASLLGSSFSGTSATFSAGSIDIGGLVSLSSSLALASSGNITESTGTIDVPLLTSGGTTIGGNAALTNNTNNIGTLGGFTLAPGGSLSLALDDNGLLTVAGPVFAPDAVLSAGSIEITGTVGIAQTLALAASAGGVDESTGIIDAGTLTSVGPIQGTVALVNANDIGTLGNFGATGYIILNNSPSLVIDGFVSTPAKLTLEQAGPITEVAGGTLAVGTLGSGAAVTGNVALGNANSIVTLGGFTVGAGDTLALNDTGLLTIAGPVAAPFATISSDAIAVTGSMTGGAATLSAGSIGIGGSISLATLLALESSGDITETGGFVTVPTLTSGGTAIGGNVTLGDANSIGSLGSFTETGTLILTDAGSLAVSGPVNTGNATLTADGISVPGSIGTGTLALFSGSDVTETGGAIQAALLIGTVSAGSATLQGTNTIATLGAFDVTAGTLALTDTGLLTVAGPVVAPTATLASNAIEVSGRMSGAAATLTAGSIDISGLITTTSNLALESTGNVTETGGTIATALLTSGGTTIGGNALLTGGGNGIGTLGAFVAAGTLALDDTGLLTVRGLVNAPTTTLSSGSIAMTGSINAATVLALESTGNITEPGGFISTPTLTSGGTPVGGNVSLTDVNAIGTLAGFTDNGTFILADSGLLTAAGPVAAPVVTLSSPTIAITGGINAATLLALDSTGNVFEGPAGAITTGTLTSGAGGNVTLNTAFNNIGTLGAFTAAGLALNDQTPLAIASPVSIAGVLALLDTGNITQTGGTISAATLTSDGGTIGGAASFNQAGNDIPILGAFGAVAGLALTDAVPLNLAGNIFTGSTAPLTLVDPGNPITQTGGAISTGTLNATAGNVTLGQANTIGDLGNVNAANLYVNGVASIGGPVVAATFATILSPGALPVSGNISAGSNLVLEALGDITQTGGSIASGPAGSATFISGGEIVLSGAMSVADQLDLIAGGNILHPAGQLAAGTLAGAVGGYVTTALGTVMGNGTLTDFSYSSLTTDFNTIGNFIMHDSTFALNNDGPLAIVGSLVADVILITTNGSLTLVGSSDGSGGGLFINSGSIASTAYFTPHPTDSVINVNNGSVFQTGNFNINTANGPPGTLFLYVNDGGIQFVQAPDELFAPFINLEISDPGGIIAGNVDLDRLVILDAATRSVELTGTLDGLQGQAAASKGIVDPFPRPEFRFNACPIGSVNCTILPIESLPPGNPLENFDLTQRKRKKLDKNVHLPGVATRDF